MVKLIEPSIDTWYQNQETGLNFKVVAFDPQEDSFQIQYVSGEIEQIEIEEWYQLSIAYSEEPFLNDENESNYKPWANPLDDAELDF